MKNNLLLLYYAEAGQTTEKIVNFLWTETEKRTKYDRYPLNWVLTEGSGRYADLFLKGMDKVFLAIVAGPVGDLFD